MTTKPFASSADLSVKQPTMEVLADGVYALTAEGDPNIGAIEGEDFLVCIEALATPVAARTWLTRLRVHTDKPVRYLVLSHYHAVRVLGASAFDAEIVVAHENTRALVAERGMQDWASEFARMPRLADGADSVPGLTWPTLTFSDRLIIDLGGDRGDLELRFCGRGHTEGDVVAWLPQQKILFGGDPPGRARGGGRRGSGRDRDRTGTSTGRSTSWRTTGGRVRSRPSGTPSTAAPTARCTSRS